MNYGITSSVILHSHTMRSSIGADLERSSGYSFKWKKQNCGYMMLEFVTFKEKISW